MAVTVGVECGAFRDTAPSRCLRAGMDGLPGNDARRPRTLNLI